MSSTAIKAIVLMGVVAFALLGLTSVGLKKLVQSSGAKRVAVAEKKSPFDSARAYADLNTVVGFGPRIPGSEALAKLRGFIERQLKSAGVKAWEHAFEAATPLGKKQMVNVVGEVQGTKPGIIVLSNHYDTKYFPDFTFVGANDGGSTTAWMIEMARVLGAEREGRTVYLCFFDGEEAFGEWSATDGIYGSRAFVDHLRETGRLADVRAAINVDMIGDCYLGIKQDRDAPDWLSAALWSEARELGYTEYFLPFGMAIDDDHIPFRRAGIPAIDVIDFVYGASQAEHVRTWHTANDTLEHVCAESLQVVGDTIYHALPRVDAYLDKSGQG
jgi:hypothetical protein